MTDLTDAQQLQLQLECTEQTVPTALTAQYTEQRHLYEPLMGASRECQVVPGTTPTALLAGAGTTKVGAHTHRTAHTARRESDSSNLNSVATHAVVVVKNRGSALTDNACRGMNYSACPNAAVNTARPIDTRVVAAIHRNALTDDGDRNAAYAAVEPVDPMDSDLTRSLCNLVTVVHRDINCSSSSESDCIRSAKADLHNPECSSDPAGTVVNAPLNVSSALSPLSSLAQPHSAKDLHSVPYSRQQGEYPPRVVTRVRGDLSPPCHDGVYPQGVPSDSASPAQAGGKILGLVAPLTHVAVSSPVAEFDPSGLVRAGPACHSIVRQSSSQSEAHTALSTTDGLREPLDSSKFPGNPSCGPSHAPTHTHSHTAFQF